MNTTGTMNPILQRLFDLMAEKGVNAKQVTETLHMSGSSFTDWKKGRASPGVEALSKLAPYFHVSLDYLITGHEFEFTDDAKPRSDPRSEESAGSPEPAKNSEASNLPEISNQIDAELLVKYHRLPPELQGKVMSYLDGMLAVLPQLQTALKSQTAAQPETLPAALSEETERMPAQKVLT